MVVLKNKLFRQRAVYSIIVFTLSALFLFFYFREWFWIFFFLPLVLYFWMFSYKHIALVDSKLIIKYPLRFFRRRIDLHNKEIDLKLRSKKGFWGQDEIKVKIGRLFYLFSLEYISEAKEFLHQLNSLGLNFKLDPSTMSSVEKEIFKDYLNETN
jgi:hypothetical protein